MGRRTRELILAATVCGVLIWGLQKPVYRACVLNPAMAQAVEKLDAEAIRRLAVQGADVNINLALTSTQNLIRSAPKTPVGVAVSLGDLKTLRLLIRKGAEFDSPDQHGKTPLMCAATFAENPRMVSVAEELIRAGARVNARYHEGQTALILAVDQYTPGNKLETIAMVQTLLDHGADANVAPDDFTALARAEEKGATRLVGVLRKAGGADRSTCLERIAAKGPLHAVRSGKLEAVKRLVRRKVSFRGADEEGTTLTVAAQDYTATYLPYLLKHARGIDRAFLNDRGGGTETPLTAAARINHWVNAQHLLKAGADPSIPDAWGNTPLHLAAMTGRTSMAQLLLKAGANPNARDNAGRTPLHWAKGRRDKPMEAVLRAAGGTN